jgi:uncharacterized protein YuzE
VKVAYDAEVDVVRVLLSDAAIEESDEDKPGTILDYDSEGNIVGPRNFRCLNANAESSFDWAGRW